MPAPRVAAASDKRLRPRNRVCSATTPFLSCGGDGVTRFADDTAMLTRLLICLLAVDFSTPCANKPAHKTVEGPTSHFPRAAQRVLDEYGKSSGELFGHVFVA